MATISKEQLEEAQSTAQRALSKLSTFRQKAEKEMRYVKQSIEVGVAAFGTAWAIGRWGGPGQQVSLVGVPLEMVLFGGLHVAGYSGVVGAYDEDCHNLGDGALSVWITKKGLTLGAESAKTSTTSSGAAPPAQLPPGAPNPYAPVDNVIQNAINS